ncbi:conserved hypothetical protein, partial [delta proteobacterium NaphS2]
MPSALTTRPSQVQSLPAKRARMIACAPGPFPGVTPAHGTR